MSRAFVMGRSYGALMGSGRVDTGEWWLTDGQLMVYDVCLMSNDG